MDYSHLKPPKSAIQSSAIQMLQQRPIVEDNLRTKSSQLPPSSAPEQKDKSRRYVPYTLKDYNVIKPDKYYQLGGLGSANIGTEDWVKRQEALYKRKNYARQVEIANTKRLASLPPGKPKSVEKRNPSTRERAIEFARNIPKPKPRSNSKKNISEESPVPKQISKLEQLEQQHHQYKATIESIRAKI